MRWPITIIVLLAVLAVSLGLYRLESEVQTLERRLAKATAQLEQNRRDSRILAAEWSFLNQPGRLEELALRHLDLTELRPSQIGHLAASPIKPSEGTGVGAVKVEPSAKSTRQPPRPRLKPVKPPPGSRIVLAEGGRARQ